MGEGTIKMSKVKGKDNRRGKERKRGAEKAPLFAGFIILQNGNGCRNVRMQLCPILPDVGELQ